MPSAELRSDDEMLAATRERARELRVGRTRRQAVGAGLAVVLLVVVSAVIVRSRADDAPVVYATEDTEVPTTIEPSSVPEGWSPMAASPLAGRAGAVSAWTGEEWLIWGGDGAFTDVCTPTNGALRCGEQALADGAAYDPILDSWRMLPPAPVAPDQGDQLTYSGVWTGTELVLWGGPDGQGAAYDPKVDAWRSLPAPPISAGRSFTMVWSGREVIIVGGLALASAGLPTDVGELEDGAAYDPVADTWRTIAPPGSAGIHGAGVWCDGSLVLLDELTDAEPPGSTAAAYRPDTDTWSALPPSPVEHVSGAVCAGPSVFAVGTGADPATAAAATLDVAAGSWTTSAPPPFLDPPDLALVWNGGGVVALGSSLGTSDVRLAMATFDPATDSWTRATDPPLTARSGVAAAWTGDALLVWGGAVYGGFTSEPLADGARYRASGIPASGPPSTTAGVDATAGPATTVAGVDATAPPTSSGETTTSFPGEPASLPRSPIPDPGDEYATWMPATVPSEGSTSLEIDVGYLACREGDPGDGLRAPVVVETADAVIVTLFTKSPPPGPDGVGSGCTRDLTQRLTIELPSPIGDRWLYDGALDPPNPVWRPGLR